VDVNIKEVDNISSVPLDPVEISSVDQVQKISPVAVHVKELNQIAPLQIETLRIDRLREIDPLTVDRLNVTRLPVVNLSVNQVPEVAIGVSRLPPVALAVQQCFHMPSDYTARARFLGFEFLRLHLTGHTHIIPQERTRPAHVHTPNVSFPIVTEGGPAQPLPHALPHPRCLRVGRPRFAYGARR
jgi:hypothetical protein